MHPLSSATTANNRQYLVISDLALVVVESDIEPAGIGAGLGGLAGAAVDEMASAGSVRGLGLSGREIPPLERMADVMYCAVLEVPESLTGAPGWPKVSDFRQVVFYPKTCIESIRSAWWGRLVITLRREAAREVPLQFTPWQVPGLKRRLQGMGYPLAI